MTTPMAGLVLDVDDTLYLERSYVHSGFSAVEAWARLVLQVPEVGHRAWDLFQAGRRRTTIADALVECGVVVTTEVLQDAVGVYRSHEPRIELLADAARFLQWVRGRIPVAIVTDGPAESQWAKVRALGLDQVVDRVVVSADLGWSKPDPRVFRLAVDGWTIEPSRIVYVADNPVKDFDGPAQLGWRSVRVRRSGALHADMPTPAGVSEVPDLDPTRLRTEFGWGQS